MWLFDNIFLDKDTPTAVLEAPNPEPVAEKLPEQDTPRSGSSIPVLEPIGPSDTGSKIVTSEASTVVDIPSVPPLIVDGVAFDIGGDIDFASLGESSNSSGTDTPSGTFIQEWSVIAPVPTEPVEAASTTSIAMIQGATGTAGSMIVDGLTLEKKTEEASAPIMPTTEPVEVISPLIIGEDSAKDTINADITPSIVDAIIPTEAVVESQAIEPVIAEEKKEDAPMMGGLFGFLDASTQEEKKDSVITWDTHQEIVSDVEALPIIEDKEEKKEEVIIMPSEPVVPIESVTSIEVTSPINIEPIIVTPSETSLIPETTIPEGINSTESKIPPSSRLDATLRGFVQDLEKLETETKSYEQELKSSIAELDQERMNLLKELEIRMKEFELREKAINEKKHELTTNLKEMKASEAKLRKFVATMEKEMKATA